LYEKFYGDIIPP